MKFVSAKEARQLAQVHNFKKYKKEFDQMMDDVTFCITEAYKSGQFSINFELDYECSDEAKIAFLNYLLFLEYDIKKEANSFKISWGIQKVSL